jgi:hypothetical protein
MANQLVQWWRTERPQDASLSDEDLTFKIADLAPEYAKQGRDIFAEYPDFASDYDSLRKGMASEYRKSTTTIGGEVGRGLQRGLTGLKSTAYGAAALAADAMPGQFADPVRDAMLRKYKAAQEEAAKEDVVPSVGSYKEVSGVRDVGQYLAGLAGEALPSIAESVVTGAIGAVAGSEVPVAGNVAGGIAGIVGKQAAKRLIAKKIAGYTAQEIEDAALRGVGSEALKQLVRAETRAITAAGGAAIANTLNSYGMSAGEIYGELATNPNVKPEDALGIAVAAAIPAAIADTALPGYVINKSGVLRRLAGQIENFGETEKRGFFGYIARLAAELPKVSTMEGGTEAFQELVNIAATKYGETGKFDLSLTDADKERIINAGIAGGVGGAVAAPAAAVRLDKQDAKPAVEKPSEAKQAEQAEQAAAVTPPTQEQTPPAAGEDVLEIGYDTNIDGIKELAQRKIAGEDVSAEESQLKPDAARRYQREVIAASEAKASAEAEAAAPTEAAATGVAATETTATAAPEETPAVPTEAAPSVESAATEATATQPAPTNANQEPSPVEVPSGEGAQAAAQVAEGAAAPVQEVADQVEEGKDVELSPEAEAAKASMSKDAKALKSQVDRLKQKIASLENLTAERAKQIETAEALVKRYTAASEIADKEERAKVMKELNKELKTYGYINGLQTRLEKLNVLETDSSGKPSLLMKQIGKDPRKTVAARMSLYVRMLNKAQSKLSLVNDDIDTLMITESPSQQSRMPAYYEYGDQSDESSELMRLYSEAAGSKGVARQSALNELGYTLTSDARDKESNQRHSKRLTAWVKRSESGNPTEVIVTTSHREPIPKGAEGNFNPVDRYVFAVSNTEYEQSGQKKKVKEKKANVRTITQMIDDGYMPYASILLGTARHRSVQRFIATEAIQPSPESGVAGSPEMSAVESFNATFKNAKDAAGANNPIDNKLVYGDEQALTEYIDAAAKDAADILSDQELEFANEYFKHIQQKFLEESSGLLEKGQYAEAVTQSTLGKMLALYDELTNAKASESQITRSFLVAFKDDIDSFLKAQKGYASPKDAAIIAESVPSYISGSAVRQSMYSRAEALRQTYQGIKLNKLKKTIQETQNENDRSAGTTEKQPATGTSGEADRNGGNNGKGDGGVKKEDAQAKVSKAGKTAAGSVASKKRAASRADVAKATAAKADKSKRTDAASKAKKRAAKSEVVKRDTQYAFNPTTGRFDQVSNKVADTVTPTPALATAPADKPKKATKKEAAESKKTKAEPTIEQRKEAALEAVAKLLAAKLIKQKDYNGLIDAINAGTPAQIQEILEKSQAAESSARDNKSVISLKETVLNLEEQGLIDKTVRKAMLKKIDQNASNQEALDTFAKELKEFVDRDAKNTRKRLSQADPEAIESVDLQSGRITPVELLPNSIENIEHNIRRFSPPARSLLTQSMDTESVSQKYTDLNTALRRIAIEAATDSSPMSVIRATIAKAMMDRVAETGAKLVFADQSLTPGVLGSYNIRNNEIVIYTGAHSTDIDLQSTILEETLHAFTSKARLAFDTNPESLSPALRDAITGLNGLIEAAKKTGLKWQESDSADAAVAFDEFVAAAVRDDQFKAQLAQIPFNKDFGVKKATTLLEAIKLQFAKILEAIVSAFPIFGNGGKTGGMTALDASSAFINAMVTNHQKVATEQGGKEQRYRHVEGTLGTGAEITVDGSQFSADATAEAKRLMALQNLIQDAATRMVDMWNRKGNNRSSQGTQLLSNDQAIKNMILDVISDSMPLPSEAKQAINKALTDQGANAISDTITMGDLEQRSDAPKVARDGLNALNTVLFNLKKMRADAEELFGRKNILQKIADSSFEISELTKKFEDMNFIGKEFVKELRRSIDESEDVGAGSIAKAMGMTTGRKASLQNAATWIQSNLNAYTDALVALAELGVDFKNTPPADILKTVNAAAANDARLVPMQDIGRLAMAGQFARRRPMVMDLLATRSSGEAGALRSIIAMATSSRPDAVELAKRDLSKLKRIGGIAARIIDQLSEMKAEHRKMLDQAKLHAEREQFAVDAEAALTERIKSLERMLQVEDTAGNKQWQPHHDATYFVPTFPNQSEDSLFQDNPTSQSYRKLRFGQDFDGAKVRGELALMKGWLDANQNLRGTAKYNLMKRQIDGLTKVYAEEVDANVRRGPFGMLVRALGSSADRLEQLGLASSKEAATMIRRYVASFEQSLKSVDAKSFHEFDALMRKGVELSGLHPSEFKRQYYNRPLGYLETRQDLLNPALSPQAQEDVLVREAIRYMERSTPMSDELKTAVGNLLRKAGRNGEIIIGRNRVNFGLKVADVMKDGRVYLREPIGHPLSTAARSLDESIRVLANKMEPAWKEAFTANGEPDTKLKAATVSNLYTTDVNALRSILAGRFTEEVMSKFVKPLVSKTGKTNFTGPNKLGVVDMAKRENLVEAYRLSGGDIIKFAEELHRLEGGDPSTLADFAGETIGTFQEYASTLFQVADTAGKNPDEDADPGLNFLNARQGEDFPWEWLDYKEYGYKNRTRYLRVMAQQFAFGDGQEGFARLIEESRRQLTQFKDEYEDAHKMLNAGDRAGYEKAMNEGGNRIARQNAQANLLELNAAEKHHSALMKELNGHKQSAGVFSEILGIISGMTVQGLATAATDSVTLFEAPLRKFGFTKEAIQFIAGTWKALGTEIAGTLAQAFGMQFHQDTATARETDILNRNGMADSDSITSSRGFAALHERYIQELSEELTFSAITERYKNERIKMAQELAAGAVKRVAKAGKVFLEAGIGKAKDDNQAFASLKLLNPFTQASIWMHRAAARQWLRTINNAVLKAEIYFKAHPQPEADPNFRFTAKELGYSGKSLTGMKLDNRAWTFLSEKLAQAGISIEDAARKKMRGEDPLNFNQVQSALSLAQTEILLNTSPVTRPAWSQDTMIGRLSTPLVGWALYKSADVAKTAAGPKSKGDLKAFASFMEAMLLGVLPISLAYAFLRDEYEEEVLKKKQNVMPLRADATLPAAILDATSRLGMLGIVGEIPNSIVNQSTQREMSVDSRVFAVSSALALKNAMSTAYNQGTVTYQSVVRPMMQAFGGSGYLQNFDAINGLAGLDNVESRLAKRINVGNHLRVAGRMNDIEIRSGRGMVTTANPVKPHVVNMVLAAYANDARSFRESYQKALMAAKDHYPDSDPYEKVASAFESQHPLKSVFSTRPTTAEYQKMLLAMGDEGAEVGTAIRNLNSYGSQVLTKRGGSGIKPFYGTETTKRSTDYRSMLTR